MFDFIFSTISGGSFRIKADTLAEAQSIYLKRIGIFYVTAMKADNHQEPERNVTPRPLPESRRMGFGNL
jgi:hypothetical protein